MEIKKAILHIIDREAGSLICSQRELDLKEYAVKQYLDSVLKRLEKAEFKTGILQETSEFALVLKNDELEFIEKSAEMAQMVFDSLSISEDAPSGDLLVVELEELNGVPKFGLIKFNYKPSFTHHVTYLDDLMQNNIILNKTIFPSTTQRIDECCLINLETLELDIVEKKYSFEGQNRLFFTERFLQIDPKPTVTENLKIIKKAVKEVANKYNEEEYVSMSQTQQAIFESIEEDGIISKEKIAEAVFETNESAKQEYFDIIEQTKFSEEIPSNVPKYEKKYSKQKFKLTNGIELSIPADVFKDPDLVEFINNPDGTISVMIKNVEQIISKF
ncbi:nucleoid-associated protein [Vagococcus carniphilus]|uniref:Nucleoid-associated protein n=1 Tax=Vagococcus carniphilus TaxID=218144 RepID=A0AAW8U8D4_9ENTE|nr:nucleoid-associated protein [Vagococcus carniphilus]MDT2816077.1 nucleoid-associated protein [Vagococcus carniphilus]MDT2830842.1 nucleoid-associated protein [Vagococcus carniphilus]MDT2834465.1 nucleoid-associated protein [Vagococcus carniphilus]MDT2839386.1 nucleoid-associated protein [Vagococcus carniphilus]MDT2854005.1 nucleoid-associated protein [Vagococcus carniphilus]